MAVDTQSEEARIIRQLIPLSTLPTQTFVSLCGQLTIEHAEQGTILFKRGDENDLLYYLLDGSINLQTETFTIETISAGSDSARFAIAHQMPRKVDAVANSRIQFLRLNADMMKMTTEKAYEENESTMTVDEPDDSDDWMTTLLKSPIFRSLPPANLQKLLMSLEEVACTPGQAIIRQGDPGDYYYIIKKGQAIISRKPSANAKDIKLSKLADLDTFGEDALISGEPRSTSITAVTDMTLLRLGKEQFISLIKLPTLKYVGIEELHELMKQGAEVIDVRGPDEYKHSHLPKSTNVPFFSLRMYLKTLNRHHPIIVTCKDGKTSEMAAFILQQNKFNALILKNGIAGLSQDKLSTEPASFNIDDGTETGNLSGPSSESSTSTPTEHKEPQTEELAADDLRQVVQQLKAKCRSLEAEKMTLELKCSSLARQLEKMKSELERVRGK
ncbi:cyclic nucleotide-binding domain-containing protein [Methylomonas methanica]|uniref:Putative transcriptional regulator, Crp/Fnr family n=1 Tax=Methylomonas methanica (strain DSM 25384 / MC09) TaxID=857087 RepID=F9ZY02_METMM|nr:cyclic nucleotide-binding domain-containing protein [Methylomonas methanica]AEF98581.1 putative transcriptional regulator, Crp/Fnr family [Methylomonas methanica MC09]